MVASDVLVSVLIPCHNAERWVACAIESALAQTWGNKEVIVVDDGSTDGSAEIIKRFAGRVQCHSQANQGSNPTRNRLLELSRGEWLQYLDADDYLLADKIQKQMDVVESHPDADIIYGPQLVEEFPSGRQSVRKRQGSGAVNTWRLVAGFGLPTTVAPLWRRQAVIDVDAWDPKQPCCQEYDLYLRLIAGGKRFQYCDHVGGVYRSGWNQESVFHRDVRRSQTQRLELLSRAERLLMERGEMTPDLQATIDQSRFRVARTLRPVDQDMADGVVASIRQRNPRFRPGTGAASRVYRWLYGLLGFEGAEQLAAWRRAARASSRSELTNATQGNDSQRIDH